MGGGAAKAAPTREVIEIGQVLKAYGARYVTHMRDEAEGVLDSLEETFEIGRECDSRAIVSHHKVQSGDEAGLSTHTLACIDHHAAHQPVIGRIEIVPVQVERDLGLQLARLETPVPVRIETAILYRHRP